MSCGEKETHNNYFVPIGSFFADFILREAIKSGVTIVVPVNDQDNAVVNEEKTKKFEKIVE